MDKIHIWELKIFRKKLFNCIPNLFWLIDIDQHWIKQQGYIFPKIIFFPPPPFSKLYFSPMYLTDWRKINIFSPLSTRCLDYFPYWFFSLFFTFILLFSPFFFSLSSYFPPKFKKLYILCFMSFWFFLFKSYLNGP